MSTEAVSPLRRRMIEDMTIRQSASTKRDYVRQVPQSDQPRKRGAHAGTQNKAQLQNGSAPQAGHTSRRR